MCSDKVCVNSLDVGIIGAQTFRLLENSDWETFSQNWDKSVHFPGFGEFSSWTISYHRIPYCFHIDTHTTIGKYTNYLCTVLRVAYSQKPVHQHFNYWSSYSPARIITPPCCVAIEGRKEVKQVWMCLKAARWWWTPKGRKWDDSGVRWFGGKGADEFK